MSRPDPAGVGRVVATAVLVNLIVTGLVVVALRWPSPQPIRLVEPTPASADALGSLRAVEPVGLDATDQAAPIKVDINMASAGELEALPGIGPALAERIVRYRDEHGPFSTIEELMNVQGIGPATLDKMRGLVTAG